MFTSKNDYLRALKRLFNRQNLVFDDQAWGQQADEIYARYCFFNRKWKISESRKLGDDILLYMGLFDLLSDSNSESFYSKYYLDFNVCAGLILSNKQQLGRSLIEYIIRYLKQINMESARHFFRLIAYSGNLTAIKQALDYLNSPNCLFTYGKPYFYHVILESGNLNCLEWFADTNSRLHKKRDAESGEGRLEFIEDGSPAVWHFHVGTTGLLPSIKWVLENRERYNLALRTADDSFWHEIARCEVSETLHWAMDVACCYDVNPFVDRDFFEKTFIVRAKKSLPPAVKENLPNWERAYAALDEYKRQPNVKALERCFALVPSLAIMFALYHSARQPAPAAAAAEESHIVACQFLLRYIAPLSDDAVNSYLSAAAEPVRTEILEKLSVFRSALFTTYQRHFESDTVEATVIADKNLRYYLGIAFKVEPAQVLTKVVQLLAQPPAAAAGEAKALETEEAIYLSRRRAAAIEFFLSVLRMYPTPEGLTAVNLGQIDINSVLMNTRVIGVMCMDLENLKCYADWLMHYKERPEILAGLIKVVGAMYQNFRAEGRSLADAFAQLQKYHEAIKQSYTDSVELQQLPYMQYYKADCDAQQRKEEENSVRAAEEKESAFVRKAQPELSDAKLLRLVAGRVAGCAAGAGAGDEEVVEGDLVDTDSAAASAANPVKSEEGSWWRRLGRR